MKYKVGDIVQFEKDCVLPTGKAIAAGSRWRVKEVEGNYYELWYRDERLPDITEQIEYELVDDCCEKINTAPSVTERMDRKYKVGDKVRVRKDLQVHDYAGKVASYGMTEYAGDEVTIRTHSGDSCGKYYTIEEDGGRYAWTETMFEGLKKNETVDEQSNNNSGSNAIKPDYYQFHGYDLFDIAEHFGLDFPLGNALKYLLRCKRKENEEQDLRKAIKCIERHLEMIKRDNQKLASDAQNVGD